MQLLRLVIFHSLFRSHDGGGKLRLVYAGKSRNLNDTWIGLFMTRVRNLHVVFREFCVYKVIPSNLPQKTRGK